MSTYISPDGRRQVSPGDHSRKEAQRLRRAHRRATRRRGQSGERGAAPAPVTAEEPYTERTLWNRLHKPNDLQPVTAEEPYTERTLWNRLHKPNDLQPVTAEEPYTERTPTRNWWH